MSSDLVLTESLAASVSAAPVPAQRKRLLVPSVLDLTSQGSWDGVLFEGFARPEPSGLITDGPEARIDFCIDPNYGRDVILQMEVRGVLHPTKQPAQTIEMRVNDSTPTVWTITDPVWLVWPVVLPERMRGQDGAISISLTIPTCQSPLSLGMGQDTRRLGVRVRRLILGAVAEAAPYSAPTPWLVLQSGRHVGTASRRTYDEKIRSGFWTRYINGPKVLDIGCKGNDALGKPLQQAAGLPIIEGAIGVDLDYPGYNGRVLPFPSESQDAVYSSHCLEHIDDSIMAIQEWHRVLKTGGHIIVIVPHAHLYERRRRPPSRWNKGHRRMYTSASLLAEFEAALPPNSYRVRQLLEDDRGYRYEDPPDKPADGGREIELVVQKIKPPAWAVAD